MIKQWNSRQTFASMMSSQNDLCSEMGEREPMSSENWELGKGMDDRQQCQAWQSTGALRAHIGRLTFPLSNLEVSV